MSDDWDGEGEPPNMPQPKAGWGMGGAGGAQKMTGNLDSNVGKAQKSNAA